MGFIVKKYNIYESFGGFNVEMVKLFVFISHAASRAVASMRNIDSATPSHIQVVFLEDRLVVYEGSNDVFSFTSKS